MSVKHPIFISCHDLLYTMSFSDHIISAFIVATCALESGALNGLNYFRALVEMLVVKELCTLQTCIRVA